ncbi:hypothetical protein DCS_05753 [Drechmeria coniospora]|uniref:Uncharacterized protein n=1 Tax=Drechmeria coniospora TaxID=98403 RepID=A0A151GNR7_DRECN|nr:hypothetical protein DCS_05753 [Drechmeria coniospora]KYK58736.1 hypothetical protein DCS_05753 [Drechmeria coniospora]
MASHDGSRGHARFVRVRLSGTWNMQSVRELLQRQYELLQRQYELLQRLYGKSACVHANLALGAARRRRRMTAPLRRLPKRRSSHGVCPQCAVDALAESLGAAAPSPSLPRLASVLRRTPTPPPLLGHPSISPSIHLSPVLEIALVSSPRTRGYFRPPTPELDSPTLPAVSHPSLQLLPPYPAPPPPFPRGSLRSALTPLSIDACRLASPQLSVMSKWASSSWRYDAERAMLAARTALASHLVS